MRAKGNAGKRRSVSRWLCVCGAKAGPRYGGCGGGGPLVAEAERQTSRGGRGKTAVCRTHWTRFLCVSDVVINASGCAHPTMYTRSAPSGLYYICARINRTDLFGEMYGCIKYRNIRYRCREVS